VAADRPPAAGRRVRSRSGMTDRQTAQPVALSGAGKFAEFVRCMNRVTVDPGQGTLHTGGLAERPHVPTGQGALNRAFQPGSCHRNWRLLNCAEEDFDGGQSHAVDGRPYER
jgi:hypothetical protein